MPKSWLHWLVRAAALGLITSSALAQVGLQRQTWPLKDTGGTTTNAPGLIWYPTAATAQAQRFGPFAVTAAIGALPTPGAHPLVLISHGTGGNELGHVWLAQRLVAEGYVVLTLRHPGDNYEDRSGVARMGYFAERPRQVSQVLDQVLADARWAPLIDARRIAAIGHSAGGHTVLALAGGQPDARPFLAHCAANGIGLREDSTLCGLGGASSDKPAVANAEHPALPSVRDARIRAVLADSPMGLGLQINSLAAITVPVHIAYSARDEVLVSRFHGEALCRALPQARCVRSAEAGHFALFQPGTGPLGAPGADPAQDPAGFNRRAWQDQAWPGMRDFLARALR